MKMRLSVMIAALILLLGIARAEGEIASKAQLNEPGRRIGISQGSAAEEAVKAEFPEAEIAYFTDNLLGYTAVEQGKVDAYVYDQVQMQLSIDNGMTGVHLLPEVMEDTVKIAVGYSDVSKIPELKDRLNRFIAQVQADGTLEDMYRRWVLEGNSAMPKIPPAENPKVHLTVGTTGSVPPYSYYEGGGLTGYDIELARRFASWLGAELSFEIYDFDGIVPAAKSGKIDVIMSNLQYLPERSGGLPFSDILYEEKMGILVRGKGSAAPEAPPAGAGGAQPELSDFSRLRGKRVSMLTGAPFEDLVRSKAPDVGECSYLNSVTDLIMALKSGKTDAFLCNNAVSQLAVNRNPELVMFPESLENGVFGFAFRKGDPRLKDWQAARDGLSETQVQAAWKKWTGFDEGAKALPEQDWPGKNGTVTVAACDTLEPMSYAGAGGEPMGFDIELLLMMAREMDVHVDFVGMEFSAVLTSVQSGKADIGAGSIIVTDERRASVDFVEYYPAAFTLVVRAARPEASPRDGAWASFHKTFVRENRWQLFVQGICTTLLITVLAILCGTLLGFAVFMLCRKGNPVANGVTRFCLWLVQGMPMVVLLMILYYIIFGSVAISGVLVAVIGFTLTFGAAVFGLLKMGVGAVDSGQYEAAWALGYSDRRTFFRIILPQALPHVLPAYKGEIVGLIKATAIVGYIAVQDLTKMGDIVRSRTYEAFFPLIAVTIIYFALEGLIGFLVSRITVGFDPKRRKSADILKGIRADGQN